MDDAGLICCPSCKTWVEPGRYCSNCKEHLPETSGGAPAPSAAATEGASGTTVSPTVPAQELFSLRYSLPSRFVQGMKAPILLRLGCSRQLSEKTQISLVEGKRLLAEPVVRRGMFAQTGEEISLNFLPEQAGTLSVQIRIESFFDNSTESEVRVAPLQLPVEPDDGRVSGSGNVSVNVVNKDGSVLDLGGVSSLVERMGRPGKDLAATTANPRRFCPVERLDLVSTPTRITIDVGGKRFQAISRVPAWFGRQRERWEKRRTMDNAIVLNAFAFSPDGSKSKPDSTFSGYISRTHFLVEPDGCRCRIRDGAPKRDTDGNILPDGLAKPSSEGLAVNGKRLPPKGTWSLDAGEDAEVVLAPDVREGGALSFHLRAIPGVHDSERCAGALLRRNDAVKECYLPLWGAVDLVAVDTNLKGWVLSWDGARFLLRDPGGNERVLAAGDSFGLPDAPARVLPFCQRGI